MKKADFFMQDISNIFEKVVSLQDLTCDMHLHNHTLDRFFFWCLSFIRFNGAFGYIYTNNNAVLIQFMRKIKTSNFVILLMGFYRQTNKNHFDVLFFEQADSVEKFTVTDFIQILKLSVC